MVKPSAILEEDLTARRRTVRGSALPFNINATVAVAVIAAVLSVCSFVYLFRSGMTNVYGDGVAHVNIARKVVDSPDDSLWQRYIQIGSPWLPLQTVLMLPLVANDWMWRTGAAGSIVSMISFVIAALSLYLLARGFYRREDEPCRRILPVLSAAIFVLNPGALYMQSTPMTEIVFMAALVTAVCLLQRWLNQQTARRLALAGAAMSVATLARYEAWPVAALSVVIVALASRGNWTAKLRDSALFSALVAAGPVYWLWHNWAIYGNALEFLTGPNSARGINLQNQASQSWSKFLLGNALQDLVILTAAVAVFAGPLVLMLGGAGFIRTLVARRRSLLENAPAMLLIVPLFFHTLSLYRGEIQIFPLSAFGLHNVRYGLPHVLAVALFAPAAVLAFKGSARRWAVYAACLIVAMQYGYLISEGPSQLAVYQEGFRNGVNARPVRERAKVASFLMSHPPDGMVLMHTGALGPVVSQGGLRFSRTIHEGSARWHELGDAIPKDVSTVLVQRNDPLDLRLRENPLLERALESEFEERLSVGKIRVLERKK